MYVVLLINVNIKLNTWNLHVYYAGRRQGGLYFKLMGTTFVSKQLKSSYFYFQCWYQWFDFQQMWQWPLQWSALSFELSEEQERKKKFQHTTSLVAASENPWMRNFFFQSCFAVDKFIPRGHSAFKLFCVWFLVCVTIASKICEQEDGEISWSPSPHIKMAECLVMLTLLWVMRTGRFEFACFICVYIYIFEPCRKNTRCIKMWI